jgi:hypothetical protein
VKLITITDAQLDTATSFSDYKLRSLETIDEDKMVVEATLRKGLGETGIAWIDAKGIMLASLEIDHIAGNLDNLRLFHPSGQAAKPTPSDNRAPLEVGRLWAVANAAEISELDIER